MRALIIGPNEDKAILRVKEYAEQHRYNIEEMKKRIAAGGPPIGDDKGHLMEIPVGYRVCYSIEEQPIGWCHHISISVDTPGKAPNEYAVNMIMEAFGMPPLSGANCVYTEGDEHMAVNVISKLK